MIFKHYKGGNIMIFLAIVVGALGAIIGLIAFGVCTLCDESRKKPKFYYNYTEDEKDRLLKEKDRLLAEKDRKIELLTMKPKYLDYSSNYASYNSDSHNISISREEIAKEVSKGVRDGIARSQLEHGESIGNYGLSDLFFR